MNFELPALMTIWWLGAMALLKSNGKGLCSIPPSMVGFATAVMFMCLRKTQPSSGNGSAWVPWGMGPAVVAVAAENAPPDIRYSRKSKPGAILIVPEAAVGANSV